MNLLLQVKRCNGARTKGCRDIVSRPAMLFSKQKHRIRNSLMTELLTLLQKCCSLRPLQQIHAQMLTNSIHKPTFLLPRIVHLQDFNYASLFFSQIPHRNEYAFNVMIRGLTTTWRNHSLAIQFYYWMKQSGLKPDKFTFPFFFIACASLLQLSHARSAHSSVVKIGLERDSHTVHSLLTAYSRCGQLGCGRQVFDEIRDRDLVSWNSMISGYSKMGYASAAVALFEKMREEGFAPDEMTLVSVLGPCGDLGDLTLGRWIEGFALDRKMEFSLFLGSALIYMYGKCGDLLSARKIFNGMKKKDVTTWNSMLTGYSQNGMSDEAIKLFYLMDEAGVLPNAITLVGILSACASIGSLEVGMRIDTYASESGLRDNVFVATALIDMYAKCGSLDNAMSVFKVMPVKNEVSWNAMISALGFHGRPKEALSLFNQMVTECEDAQPNSITFLALLSACVHAGLVDEGQYLFYSMESSFGLCPKIEHYSCMVDLLARAGHLYDAWDLIQNMPGKPDEITLGSLLGACRKYKNLDLGERVTQLLLEMEPSNSGNYIISYQMYSNLSRWDDSAKMRTLMRERGVVKTPGCSWIDIEGQLHEFRAGKGLSTNYLGIYPVIDVLIEEMKRKGYVPNTDHQ